MERLPSVYLLDEDAVLLSLVPERDRSTARRTLTAAAYRVRRGSWQPRAAFAHGDTHFGLLVLDGLLIRDVVVGHTTCGELVGPGELLRPWDDFSDWAPMPVEVDWKVLDSMRVAVLDHDFAQVVAAWPTLVSAFMERAVERSHSLALHVAIHCIRRVDLSLLVLFWHLAVRFGKVTPAGIVISIRLTHEDLSKLVGATRPSVTLALGEVAERGWVVRQGDGSWRLPHEPPGEIRTMLGRRQRSPGSG